MIPIPNELQWQIKARAQSLLALHRINRKHSVGIDVVQRMLELMGEQIAQEIFKAALKKIETEEAGS